MISLPGSNIPRRHALKRAGLAMLVVSTLVGCDEIEKLPTPPPVEVKKPALPVTPPPVAEVAPEDVTEYQRPEYPENLRRNPFQPDPDVVTPVGPVIDSDKRDNGAVTAIEAFNLNQLELSAIISSVAIPKAMFIDPSGFGHVVKEGDKIGRNGGVVTDIRDNEVDVQETTSEGEGAASQVRTLRLREAEIRSDNQDELSDSERQALEKLLDSETGRRALRDKLRDQSQGASAIEGSGPPSDPRFGGIEPPK
jgi:Tfp pilus assembly protein PilP